MVNIKNKIIKWLGGYTRDEYEKSCIHKEVYFSRVEKQIIPIRITIKEDGSVPRYYARKEICQQLASFIYDHNLIKIDTTAMDPVQNYKTITATINVVEV